MLSNLAVVALAAAGAVNAGPLRRQATSAVESASSIASEASSAASSAVSSVVSGASSTAASEASGASSTAAGPAESSSAESSAVSSSAAATSTAAAGAGNETNPAFPCPAGFLLTYAAVNQTVPMMVTQVTGAVGEWASSPVFPNVTSPEGGNEPGATHTINVGNISLPEVLVSYVANDTSGSAIWTWNGSLPEPVTAMGVSLASYSTVLQIYDPDYTTTGEIGNSTFINLFTNACLTPQAEGMQLLMTLGGLELSNAAAALSGNSTTPGASSTAAESGASTAAESGASTAAESGASSATSAAESGASSASSAAESGASSATSAAESAATSAASAVESGASSAASAASSAVAAATSTSA